MRFFRPTAVLGCVLCLTLFMSAASSWAQDETSEFKRLIDLNTVSAVEKDGKWFIKVNGRAQKVPVGAVLEFQLRYSYRTLEYFSLTLDASHRFKTEFESHVLNGEVDKLYLTVSVPLEKQASTVREKIEKMPKVFPIDRAPWTASFLDKSFQLGDSTRLEKRNAQIDEFFRKTILELARINREFGAARKAAMSKERFVKDGTLDTEAWQQFAEKEVRAPIRALQAKIREAKTNTSYLGCPRDVDDLREIAAGVARRSFDRSKSLYRSLGLPYDPVDTSPRDIDINTKKKPTSKYLGRVMKRISEVRKITLE